MKRKDFIQKLIFGATGSLVAVKQPLEAAPNKQKIRLAVVFVAGFDRYDGPDAEPLLETGMPLQLNREPHNRFDPNAVEMWTGDAKLGYVPRTHSKMIAELMDSGTEVTASVLELDPEAFPYGSVKTEIFYLKGYNISAKKLC